MEKLYKAVMKDIETNGMKSIQDIKQFLITKEEILKLKTGDIVWLVDHQKKLYKCMVVTPIVNEEHYNKDYINGEFVIFDKSDGNKIEEYWYGHIYKTESNALDYLIYNCDVVKQKYIELRKNLKK